MKKKKFAFAVIAILLVLTCSLAFIHINFRASTSKGTLRIEMNDEMVTMSADQLDLIDVEGVLSNAKGESREIDTRGVQLCDILSLAGASSYTQVTLVAEDEYSAAVTAEEVDADAQVYVILQEDGGWQLVVFGDPYSKLNVSDLSRIIVT